MPGIYIDCHTHIYKQFPIAKFFEIAEANFIEQSKQSSNGTFGIFLYSIPKIGLKLPSSEDYLELEKTLKWERQSCEETGTYLFKTAKNNRFFIMEGVQHASQEKLEILQLGGNPKNHEVIPFEPLLNDILSDGKDIVTIPWAFGKWTGKRGALVADALQIAKDMDRFFIGDNSGRATFISKSKILEDYEATRGFNLTGSDPLPFSIEIKRVGKSGIHIDTEEFNPLNPLNSIQNALKSGKVESYIQLKPALPFMIQQLRLKAGI